LRKGRGKPNAGIGVHQPGGGDGSGSGSGNSMEFSLEAEEEGDASDGHDMVGGWRVRRRAAARRRANPVSSSLSIHRAARARGAK